MIDQNKNYDVIYLEDDDYYPEILKALLENSNFNFVHHFKTLDYFKQNLIKNPFDIGILDIIIDTEELYDVLEFIKNINPKSKLMIISSLLDGRILYKYKNFGINCFVSKNSIKRDFQTAIKNLVDNRPFYSSNILEQINLFEKTNNRLVKVNKNLTNKQKFLLELLLERNSTPEIANKLNISNNTVLGYYQDLKDKINDLIIGEDLEFKNYKKIVKTDEIKNIFI